MESSVAEVSVAQLVELSAVVSYQHSWLLVEPTAKHAACFAASSIEDSSYSPEHFV